MKPKRDRELDQLIEDVDRLFGEEASCDANNRAADTVAYLVDAESDVWLRAFTAAWKAELRRLLHPH